MHVRSSILFRQKVLAPSYQTVNGLSRLAESDLTWLYSALPGRRTLKTAGPAFITAKFAINAGVWPHRQA
ncbi:hypothetical protein C4K37_1600 [Pseudomonas chlororaphis subsp. piscium]|nr:hypothetical protein C4K37_1600 [Pseudomonas chlororaphis subsp. piscium]AZC42547.1 hypothetical protein C4K36_1607 [Pseudomonas chlororaphis subsp. piscium]AZC68267.1 hypothetical protein C4K32_1590 [Pseudomonas chlororaphis subsp. piscium]